MKWLVLYDLDSAGSRSRAPRGGWGNEHHSVPESSTCADPDCEGRQNSALPLFCFSTASCCGLQTGLLPVSGSRLTMNSESTLFQPPRAGVRGICPRIWMHLSSWSAIQFRETEWIAIVVTHFRNGSDFKETQSSFHGAPPCWYSENKNFIPHTSSFLTLPGSHTDLQKIPLRDIQFSLLLAKDDYAEYILITKTF